MALDTLKVVESQIGKSLPKPKSLPLIGSASISSTTNKFLESQLDDLKKLLPDTSLKDIQIKHLQGNHGLAAKNIINEVPPEEREPLSQVIPICKAEITHAIKHELAKTSTDILARRCRLAMVDIHEAERLSPLIDRELEKHGLSPTPLNLQL